MAASSRPIGPRSAPATSATLPPGTSLFVRAAQIVSSNPALLPPKGSKNDSFELALIMYNKLASLIMEERYIEAKSIFKMRLDWLDLEVETRTADNQNKIESIKQVMLQKLCELI